MLRDQADITCKIAVFIDQRKGKAAFEALEWEEVAAKMGRKATKESVRKEFQRFMDEK